MNNSYITIIKEKRTALSRKRVPLNQNECTDDFRIGVPFEQNLQESKQKTVSLASEYAQKQIAVVSGMAKGIDSYAHTACLNAGGYTIAILGNGLDICYPSEHHKLMRCIEEKGLLISEYPPGTPPDKYRFPRRNRLISSWSDKLFVIEAGRGSGALITAEYGRKYGHEVEILEK